MMLTLINPTRRNVVSVQRGPIGCYGQHIRRARHRYTLTRRLAVSERPEAETLQVPSEVLEVPAYLNLSTKNVPYVQALLNYAASTQLGKADDPVYISDIVSAADKDAQTQLQYVHLVLAAAGMLAITYVGFIWMLEAAGIRFLGLGGSSAGAITAGTIAMMRERPDKPCSQNVLKALSKANFGKLWDASQGHKELMAKDKMAAWEMLWLGWQLNGSRGLAPDYQLRKWLQSLQPKTGYTWGELLEKMRLTNHPAEDGNGKPLDVQVFDRTDNSPMTGNLDETMQKPEHYPLRLVATELVTQSMVVLPRDAYLFYTDGKPAHTTDKAETQAAGTETGTKAGVATKEVPVRSPSPADFVLASCSVPVYFKPFEHTLPGQILAEPPPHSDWEEQLLYGGKDLPHKVVFADGAILSNLPMQLFSGTNPKLPKIGVTVDIGRERTAPLEIDCLHKFIQALSTTTRLLNDRNYRHQNPGYKDCMVTINASDFRQLDFAMLEAHKETLLIRGMEAGRRFLDKWKKSNGCWDKYKDMHAKLEEARALGATAQTVAGTVAAAAAEATAGTTATAESSTDAVSEQVVAPVVEHVI